MTAIHAQPMWLLVLGLSFLLLVAFLVFAWTMVQLIRVMLLLLEVRLLNKQIDALTKKKELHEAQM